MFPPGIFYTLIFTYFNEYRVPDADTLVVAYGVTARAAKVAVKRLQDSAHPASLLVLKTLWPVPETLIREKAAAHKRVVMPEMNRGQYVRELHGKKHPIVNVINSTFGIR